MPPRLSYPMPSHHRTIPPVLCRITYLNAEVGVLVEFERVKNRVGALRVQEVAPAVHVAVSPQVVPVVENRPRPSRLR